jgi:hypothetical protein
MGAAIKPKTELDRAKARWETMGPKERIADLVDCARQRPEGHSEIPKIYDQVRCELGRVTPEVRAALIKKHGLLAEIGE